MTENTNKMRISQSRTALSEDQFQARLTSPDYQAERKFSKAREKLLNSFLYIYQKFLSNQSKGKNYVCFSERELDIFRQNLERTLDAGDVLRQSFILQQGYTRALQYEVDQKPNPKIPTITEALKLRRQSEITHEEAVQRIIDWCSVTPIADFVSQAVHVHERERGSSVNESNLTDLYKRLPLMLKKGVDKLTDDTDKECFLIGALGVISGILPNVYGKYDGNSVGANLYIFVNAPYGSGKGALSYCKILGSKIHKGLREESDRDTDSKKECMLYIPANISKTGLAELLANNNNRAVIFETEADTLTDILKQDYANYSDILRNAFHHETPSFYRRTDKEYQEIENPHLSVILSGTFDQLQALIPSPENGLFSRFLFYELEPTEGF